MANTFAFTHLHSDTVGDWTENVNAAVLYLQEYTRVMQKGRSCEATGRIYSYLDYSDLDNPIETLPKMVEECQGLIGLGLDQIESLMAANPKYSLRCGPGFTKGFTGLNLHCEQPTEPRITIYNGIGMPHYFNVNDYIDFGSPRPQKTIAEVESDIWAEPCKIVATDPLWIQVEYSGDYFPDFETSNYIYRTS